MSNAGDKAGAMELDPTWAPSNLDPWILETGPKATIPELLISDIPLLGFSLCVSHNLGSPKIIIKASSKSQNSSLLRRGSSNHFIECKYEVLIMGKINRWRSKQKIWVNITENGGWWKQGRGYSPGERNARGGRVVWVAVATVGW